MATINEPVFVDGTFHCQNITFGRGSVPGGSPNGNGDLSAVINFPDGALAGTGETIVVVTGYASETANRLDSAGVRAITVAGQSPTGFTCYVNRSDTGTTTQIYYMAFRS